MMILFYDEDETLLDSWDLPMPPVEGMTVGLGGEVYVVLHAFISSGRKRCATEIGHRLLGEPFSNVHVRKAVVGEGR